MSNRPFRFLQLASLALLPATACSSMSNFTWFGLKKPTEKVAGASATPNPPPAPSAAPDDPVNQRVNEYVNGFEPDDFNSKIARQSAPSRAKPARVVRMEDSGQYQTPDAPAADAAPIASASPAGSSDERVEIVAESSTRHASPAPHVTAPPTPQPAPATPQTAQPNPSTSPPQIQVAAANQPDAPKPPVPTQANAPMAPRLKTVSIAESATQAPAASPAPSSSAALVNQSASTKSDPGIAAMIGELEAKVTASPNDVDQQVRLRMLYAAIGQDDKAIAPTPGMNTDVQELVGGLMKTLLEARSSGGRDPAASATKQLAAMEELRNSLKSRADLSIPVLAICNRIEDYGRYQTIDPPDFPGGVASKALLYVELANFKSEKMPAGEYRTLLSMRTSLLTADGAEVWSEVDDNIQDLAPRPRTEFYLMKPLFLPATLVPGDYVVKTEMEDKLGAKTNSKTTRLRILAAGARHDALSQSAGKP